MVIIVEKCEKCPFNSSDYTGTRYFCALLSSEISEEVNDQHFPYRCPLRDGQVEVRSHDERICRS